MKAQKNSDVTLKENSECLMHGRHFLTTQTVCNCLACTVAALPEAVFSFYYSSVIVQRMSSKYCQGSKNWVSLSVQVHE